MRFMIVDDHEAIRRLIRSIILSVFGDTAEITECGSGEQAAELFPSADPDCVLMDIDLPGMDGFKTIEKIYTYDPDVKVIMVTGYDDPLFKKKAEEMKLTGFVYKDQLSELLPYLKKLRKE